MSAAETVLPGLGVKFTGAQLTRHALSLTSQPSGVVFRLTAVELVSVCNRNPIILTPLIETIRWLQPHFPQTLVTIGWEESRVWKKVR